MRFNHVTILCTSLLGAWIASAMNYYVDAVNGDDSNDGLSRETAQQTLSAALSRAELIPGDVVWAAPGMYDTGTMTAGSAGELNRVVVPASVGLSSLEGAEKTFITGAADPDTGNLGPNAVRPVYLNKGAWLRGFTVTGGYTLATANGGGVLGVNDSAVADCVITNNTCGKRGGISVASIFRSRIQDNPCYDSKDSASTANYQVVLGDGQYIYDSIVIGSGTSALYGYGVVVNCTILEGGIKGQSSTQKILAVNSYIKNSDAYGRNYVNCAFGTSKQNSNSTYDSTCQFDVTPDFDTTIGRTKTNDSSLVNKGDLYAYETNFPSAWFAFKEPFDFAGGARKCGASIDIGAGEFQETRAAQEGTLFSIRGARARADRPIALMGTKANINQIMMSVVAPANCVFEMKSLPDVFAVSDYSKYAVVVIDCLRSDTIPEAARWDSPAKLAAAKAYVRAGGHLVLIGEAIDVFGAMSEAAWHFVHSSAVTRIESSLYQVTTQFSKKEISLGVADEQGEWIPSLAGQQLASLQARFTEAIVAPAGIEISSQPREWGDVPLGTAGTRVGDTTFRQSPQLAAVAPTRSDGLVLYDSSRSIQVKIHYNANAGSNSGKLRNNPLAKELAWHLKEMTGVEFTVSSSTPKDANISETTPVIYLTGEEATDILPNGTMIIRREGYKLILSGVGTSAGTSHAVTYLLEALGCRYLWPGPTGKVIPRACARIVAPEIALTNAPTVLYRNMRGSAGDNTDYCDNAGINRSFYSWHGLDGNNCEQKWAAGHVFGEYYTDYTDRLEYFALQPNGSRKLDLTNNKERPTLCLSSRALVSRKVQDITESIEAGADISRGFSICLPDNNGHTSQCLCESCRRLDPINAPLVNFTLYVPSTHTIQYPSLSDRVIHFDNSIAAGVRAANPNLEVPLSMYVYSTYQTLPVRETPDPSLVLWMVNGDYETRQGHDAFSGVIASWANAFPNTWVWRPNVLSTYKIMAPKNMARTYFNDIELFKANGAKGFDFDNVFDHWATMGLNYYAIVKAMMNVDQINYDVLYNDYLEKAFGAGATEMKKYYDNLANLYTAAREAENPLRYYTENLKWETLKGFLNAAADATANAEENENLARIDFIRQAIPYVDAEQETAALYYNSNKGKSWQECVGAFKTALSDSTKFVEDKRVFSFDSIRNEAATKYIYFNSK